MDNVIKEKSLVSLVGAKKGFGDFLNVEANKRILFSGKFGSGKTFFLQEFFVGNKNYEIFHLSPVRYQLTGTRDILELIRYDIVRLLLSRNDNAADPNGEQARLENLVAVIRKAWPAIDDVGAKVLLMNFFSKLGVDYNDLKTIYGAVEKAIGGDKQAIAGSMNSVEANIDILSVNCIDKWISEEISKLKGQKTEGDKKSVLVIDDVDRLDPAHIFRVLNALSVSMYAGQKNRYMFDRVLIVGDLENIKKIFRHTYGEDTDVEGYLSKFFTSSIYEFSIYDELAAGYGKIISKYGLEIESNELQCLLAITADLIAAEQLNIRHLSRLIKRNLAVKVSKHHAQFILRILSLIIENDEDLAFVFNKMAAEATPSADDDGGRVSCRKNFMKLIVEAIYVLATMRNADGSGDISEAKDILNKFNFDLTEVNIRYVVDGKYKYKTFYELLAEYVKHGLHNYELS